MVPFDDGDEQIEERPSDAIDNEQANLDAEQAGSEQPQYVTRSDIENMMRMMTNQITGLQSKVDKGLNSIRADAMRAAEEAKNKARALERDRLLANVDDPQTRQALEQLLAENQGYQAQAQPQATQANEDAWGRVVNFVETMGINPKDQRINYQVLADDAVPENERWGVFVKGLHSIIAKDAAGTQEPTQAAPKQAKAEKPVEPTANPSRVAGAASTGVIKSADDVYDLLISGRITPTEAAKEAAKFGVNLRR